jgi:pseudouridine-5'-phosphate glycosidase
MPYPRNVETPLLVQRTVRDAGTAAVCVGAKSILDLPKTLEYLETRGVPVIG